MAVSIQAPDGGVYGVFSPAYAQKLAANSPNVGANVLNQFVLQQLAQREQGSYADLLRDTNASAVEGARVEGDAAIRKSYFDQLANYADKDIAGAIDPETLAVNRAYLETGDVVGLNAQQQAAFKNTTGGIRDLTESGVRPSIEDIGAMITPPIQETPSTVAPYVSFEDQTGRMNADANMVSALKPNSSGGGGGGVTLSISDDGFSDPVERYSGKNPEAVRAAYAASKAPAADGGGGAEARLAQYKGIGATWVRSGNSIVITTPKGRKIQMKVNPDKTYTETLVK